MKQTASNLQDHTGYWLRILSNHISGTFTERMAKHDVSVPQWVVLRVLFDADSLPLKEIVSRVGVDQGSLSRMVERLIKRGLVARIVDVHDRRAVAISLTKEGRKLVPKLAKDADTNDQAFFGSLPEKERAQFLATIKKILTLNQSDTQSIPLE